MKTYTVHPPAGGASGEDLDRAALVKDGFSLPAFFFTFLWFFWHRLWLAGLVAMVLVLGLPALLAALDVSPGAAALAEILLSLLIGFEAGSIRRWTYERRGRPVTDVVTASSRDEAELKAVSRALQGAPPVATASLAVRPYRGPESVIGLFPDAEGRR